MDIKHRERFEQRVALAHLWASLTGMNTVVLNSHKNAHPWKGVLAEKQSVRARMARPIRMDAGILCDRAEPPFTLHVFTATPQTKSRPQAASL